MVTARRIPEIRHPNRRLGRHLEHDERSRDFPVHAVSWRRFEPVMWERTIPTLDQGDLGSCTGNALVGAVETLPVQPSSGLDGATEDVAVTVYSDATRLDKIQGEYPPTDTGSSGLAVCKVARQQGWIREYRHAFSTHAAVTALMSGPVITGVNWYEGFDDPDASGMVVASGEVRGGHEFEVLGFQPGDTFETSKVVAVNSWGPGWGADIGGPGRFWFTVATWRRLLRERGDVTVPIGNG